MYALDSDGDKVLVEDVSGVYVDDAKLQTGLLAALAANEKVKIGGDLSVHGDKLYLEANKVMNEDGVELVLEKGKTETITEEKEAVEETAGDAGGYVLPQSSSRLLTDCLLYTSLYCHTELVRKFVSWYSLRMLRLKKLKQLVLIT